MRIKLDTITNNDIKTIKSWLEKQIEQGEYEIQGLEFLQPSDIDCIHINKRYISIYFKDNIVNIINYSHYINFILISYKELSEI